MDFTVYLGMSESFIKIPLCNV